MRFFHLSDLHIGKQFYGYSLLEDQEWILNEILSLAKERKPDAVLIAGDVYDKSVPAAEAVAVFDRFLGKLTAVNPLMTVMIISGNHDSGERLSFAGSILENQKVYIVGKAPAKPEEYLKKVTLSDEWGQVDFWMLPYLKPGSVRGVFSQDEPETYEDAVKRILERENLCPERRNVILAHQFFTAGGEKPGQSESETIVVGGIDQVDTACLAGFDYAALGHIHRPQFMGRASVRYCGTPLKYSVSEWNQEKTLTEAEIKEPGVMPELCFFPLHPLRDVKILRGKLEDILKAADGRVEDDYVSVTLTDENDPYQPKERLEALFPHILEVKMDNSRTNGQEWLAMENPAMADPKEVFAGFFLQMQGREMDEEEHEILERVFEKAGESEQ